MLSRNSGTFYAIVAYTLWGLLPVYWKTVRDVPAFEILCHRMAWSLIFVLILLGFRKRWKAISGALRSPRVVVLYLTTATLIGINWFTFIWAVNSGYIVEASLGYFITPLFSVLLGMVFLGERMRPWQWGAVGVVAMGVGYLTFVYGSFPWVSLVLIITFGIYSLLRKRAPLDALEGLAIETAILFLPALGCLLYLWGNGQGAFGHAGERITVLLMLSGVATALPLLWFGAAAKRIPLTSLGMLQYISPVLQFLFGVLIYREPFTMNRFIGFAVVWIALLIYSVEGYVTAKRRGRRGEGQSTVARFP